MNKIKNLFLYAGQDKASYGEIRQGIREGNVNSFKIDTCACAFLFLILTIISAISTNFASKNTWLYVGCTALCLILYLISKLKLVNTKNVNVFMYAFMLVIYAFGIGLSIIQKNSSGVSFIALLITVPLLFVDRPIRLVSLTVVVTTAFCLLSYFFKDNQDIVEKDIWNSITFAIVAIICECIMECERFKTVLQTKKVKELSELDILTNVKNRNSYELFLKDYANDNDSITCIFADVNGLHEMNNLLGHAAGDEMLKFVAKEISDEFTVDKTYRIGGDEFISFAFNTNCDETRTRMANLVSKFEKKDYHVSFGCYTMSKLNFNSVELVNIAEKKMYASKSEYYKNNGIDRRNA